MKKINGGSGENQAEVTDNNKSMDESWEKLLRESQQNFLEKFVDVFQMDFLKESGNIADGNPERTCGEIIRDNIEESYRTYLKKS